MNILGQLCHLGVAHDKIRELRTVVTLTLEIQWFLYERPVFEELVQIVLRAVTNPDVKSLSVLWAACDFVA